MSKKKLSKLLALYLPYVVIGVLAKLHDLAQSVASLPDKVRHKQEERGL